MPIKLQWKWINIFLGNCLKLFSRLSALNLQILWNAMLSKNTMNYSTRYSFCRSPASNEEYLHANIPQWKWQFVRNKGIFLHKICNSWLKTNTCNSCSECPWFAFMEAWSHNCLQIFHLFKLSQIATPVSGRETFCSLEFSLWNSKCMVPIHSVGDYLNSCTI